MWTKSSALSFLNSSHSVIMMQQSASVIVDSGSDPYSILSWNSLLALGIATGQSDDISAHLPQLADETN